MFNLMNYHFWFYCEEFQEFGENNTGGQVALITIDRPAGGLISRMKLVNHGESIPTFSAWPLKPPSWTGNLRTA